MWSLARCSCGVPDACSDCHYDNYPPRICVQHLTSDALALLKAQEPITGETSDGYHTFNELYHHRAVLFSVIVANYKERAWKSVRHHDGTMYDGMFIVGIDTPDGQSTYHYDINPYWDMFNCKVREFAPEWDGHSPAQAIERIKGLALLKAQEPRITTEKDFENNPSVDENGYLPAYCEKIDRPIGWMAIHKGYIGARKDIRYWTGKPTDEQREAVKWE